MPDHATRFSLEGKGLWSQAPPGASARSATVFADAGASVAIAFIPPPWWLLRRSWRHRRNRRWELRSLPSERRIAPHQARRGLHRQNPQGRPPGRSPLRRTQDGRDGHRPENREGAPLDHPARSAPPGRSGDRI